jgi:hypothetical protein
VKVLLLGIMFDVVSFEFPLASLTSTDALVQQNYTRLEILTILFLSFCSSRCSMRTYTILSPLNCSRVCNCSSGAPRWRVRDHVSSLEGTVTVVVETEDSTSCDASVSSTRARGWALGLLVGDDGRVGKFSTDGGMEMMVSVGEWVVKGSVRDDSSGFWVAV